mgnify:CR=1 FL=1
MYKLYNSAQPQTAPAVPNRVTARSSRFRLASDTPDTVESNRLPDTVTCRDEALARLARREAKTCILETVDEGVSLYELKRRVDSM